MITPIQGIEVESDKVGSEVIASLVVHYNSEAKANPASVSVQHHLHRSVLSRCRGDNQDFPFQRPVVQLPLLALLLESVCLLSVPFPLSSREWLLLEGQQPCLFR